MGSAVRILIELLRMFWEITKATKGVFLVIVVGIIWLIVWSEQRKKKKLEQNNPKLF